MRIICTLLLLFAAGFTNSLQAQRILLKLTGPDGVISTESVADGYKDHLESQSFAQATNANCVNSGSTGSVSCQVNTGNLFFVVRFDKSLNSLRRLMYRGLPLTKVEVIFLPASVGTEKVTPPYYSITLEEANVVSISDAKADVDPNTIQLELAPRRIGWTYNTTDKDGRTGLPVKFGWDLTANREWTAF